jgi:TolB-like protein/DNA-binding winged helix-turn-helix (wHTH) protein/Flp pilus assembly protein TadD
MQPPLTPENGTAPPRFRIGDLEVDVGKAEVRRGDENIALPKLSFDLLYALINAAPSIVTNEDLLQRVWPGLLVSPESVSQRVKLLRTSIGDDSQQPRYILGVRGRGYRLIPLPERLSDSNVPTIDAANPHVNGVNATIPGAPTSQTPALKRSKHWRALLILGIAAVTGLVGLAIRAVVVRTHGLPSSTTNVPVTVAPSLAGATPIPVSRYSIAVLPFVDMSQKMDQAYFADGMAEEIIDLLTKIPGLKVIGRTSSFRFSKSDDLRTIGAQLGVAYLLEGSVRKSGDHIRVTAQLIDSRDGTHLFSETYDKDLTDVLKMQDEIAIALVRALPIDLETNDIVFRPALRNPEAYTLYLQGLQASNRFDQEGMEQAVSDFERVIELDPSFAPAYLLLGNAYFILGAYGFMPPAIAFEKDRLANEQALTLDPSLALAHAQLGDIHRAYDWDWAAADRELKKALALAPADGNILFYAAVQSLGMGRWDEGLKQVNAALAIDPLNPSRYQILTFIQSSRGRLEEAEAAARRALELTPLAPFGHSFLGNVLLLRSRTDAALMEFSKETVDSARQGGLAMAYFALSRKAESDAALAQMTHHPTDHPFFIARVYAFRGEPNEALKWLDLAYAQKDSGGLPLIKGDPLFRKIEGDPRYKAFLKKMNLPE